MSTDALDGIGSYAGIENTVIQVAVAVIIGAAVVYCVYYARSLFFIRDRIWTFLGGSKDFNDPILNSEWHVVRDLELFRFRYKLNVENILQVKEIKKWLIKNDISMLELRSVALFFDMSKIDLKNLNYNSRQNIASLIACVLIAFTLTSLNASMDKSHIFQIRKTEEKFNFDGNYIFLQGEKIDKKYCDSYYPGYVPDIKNIKDFNKFSSCEMYLPSGQILYKDALKEKNNWALVAMVTFFSFLLLAVRYLKKCGAAKAMHQRLELRRQVMAESMKSLYS